MRVVVAEDQLLTREGIVALLARAGVVVVGEAGDVDSVLALVDEHRPDVVLLDIRMPPTHTDEGLQATTIIHDRWPDCAVLVLSQYVEVDFVLALLEGGAASVGYLMKDRVLELATLTDALRRVSAGECVIDPIIVRDLMARRRKADTLGELSSREPRSSCTGGRGTVQSGNRPATLHRRAHGRGAHRPSLPEAGPGRRRPRQPPGAGCADVPAEQLTRWRRLTSRGVAQAGSPITRTKYDAGDDLHEVRRPCARCWHRFQRRGRRRRRRSYETSHRQ